MNISPDIRVGQLASEHPLSTRVFARRGIDYCCGGGRPLREACAERGLDVTEVIAEVTAELTRPDAREEHWDQAPIEDLVTHILAAYHRPLDEELPRLEAMAAKVLEVHRDKDCETLGELLSVFRALKAELQEHMLKEEQILFPMIRGGQGAMADGPIQVMEQEHLDAARALRRLRELTKNYQVPEHACNTWRALWHGLAALEDSLHHHIHLENNILFPRALSS